MKRILLIAGLTFCGFVPASAVAQADGQTAVEGYVFDVATKKPLANAIVRLTFSGTVAAVSTNASGFYAIPTAIDPMGRNTLTAECTTKKGVVSSDLPLYTPARPIVYRRDFYLSLPSRTKGCLPP